MKLKLVGIVITALILIPLSVRAQIDTSALILSLQKQVLQLLTQIQTLQKEIAELKTESGIQTSPFSPITPLPPISESDLPDFIRSLALGTRGDDVRKLQEFLARDRDIYPEGLITGYYGPKTTEAVKRWQRKHDIEAVGVVGPKTIAKFRELGRGVVQGLIQQGTPSGLVPPGLMMAPGIQKQVATTTPPVPYSVTTSSESITTIIPQPSYTTSPTSPWTAKTISKMTDGGIPVVVSNNALIPDRLRYLVTWVGAGGNNIQAALANQDGDLIAVPRPIYNPGSSIWKDISLIWNGEEYGLSLAVNQADGWKVYLVRIDSQGSLISSDLIGTGGPSTNAGPAVVWDGSHYALAWNPPSNDGILFARFSPSTKKNASVPTKIMKSAYACDPALSWNGTLFGVMCNSDYLAVNSQGSVIVTPVMGPCTWGTDPVPGFAGRPSILWDGSRFQTAFRDYWRAGTYRWYGVPIGHITADGKATACYGNAYGVEYPVTYTAMALAPNTRSGGQHGLGRLWLDNNRINFEEFLIVPGTATTTIPSRIAIIGEPATAVGNIVWAADTYAAVWKNDSGIQLSFWPYVPPTTTIAPPATVTTDVSLKVLSPNGGEQWYQGNTYRITWQNPLPNGFAGHEDFRWNIALSRRGVESWQLGQVPITYSYFDWKNWIFARSIPDGSDFKMKVGLTNIECQERLSSGTSVNTYCGLPSYVSVPAAGTWDNSDSTFSISSTPPPTSTPSVTTTTTSPTPTATTDTTTQLTTPTTATTTTTSAFTSTTVAATGSGTPKAPTNLTTSVSITGTNTFEIALAWLDNSDIETKYIVHRRPTYTTTATWVNIATLAANATSYTDKIYTGGTYEYHVSACTINTNTLAESCGDSSTASATLVANYCPSPYRVVASDGRCVWSCGADTQPDDPSNLNGQCVCKAGYTESSTDQFGRRVCTQTTTGSTSALPANASAVTGYVNGEIVNINWTDNSSDETSFDIYRRSSGLNVTPGAWVKIAAAYSNMNNQADFPGAGTWEYRVDACNLAGCVSNSGTVQLTVSSSSSSTATTTSAVLDSLGGLLKKLQELLQK